MTSPKPTRVRWVIFVLACAVSWLLYLHRYSWGLIKPAFRAEHPELTATELGWLDSAFMLTYAIGQVPGGLAGDVFEARGVLATIILLWSATVAGVAWMGGFWRLFGIRALFGVAQAGAYPIVGKMTKSWFPLASRTSVQGIVASMGRIGAACSSLIVATLLMGILGLSWQNTLLVISVPGIVLAVLFWVLVRDNPREHPLVNESERQLIAGEPPAPPVTSVATTGANPAMKLELTGHSLFSLFMLLVYAFASTFQDQLYVNWIPSFLVEGRGLDATTMGLFTPLPLLGGALGGTLGGFLNDYMIRRLGSRRWGRSLVGLYGKLVAAGLVWASLYVPDGRVAMGVLLLARVFGDWSLPTQWGAITDMGGRASATLFGLVNMVGAAGGFVAGPVLGMLKQHYGWEGLFFGAAGMCLVSALTWLFIDCTRRVVAD